MATAREATARPTRLALPERVAVALAAGGLGAVSAAVRVHGALHYAFWQDEVASARVIVARDPLAMLRGVVATESTPPGWYALGWLLHRIGATPEEVRLLSVAAGAALAAALVAYARRLVPLWAATLAGLAVALGYQFVFHGRELRAYELDALLTVLLATAAQRVVDEPRRRRAAALAAVVAAGSLTHYFFLFSVAAVGAWLVVSRAPRVALRAVALGLAPLAAWAPMLARQFQHDGFSFIGGFDLREVVATYWLLFARGQPRTPVAHELAPLALLAAVAAGAILLARRSEAGRLCALLAVLPLATAALLWLAGLRIYDVRNLIGVGPFAAVAVASLLVRLSRAAALGAACFCVLLLAAGFTRGERVPPVAYDRVADALVAEGWRPSDPIVVYGNVYAIRTPLEWYLPGRPRLRPGGCPCTRAFVVAGRGPTWFRLARTASELQYVRGILVARVDATRAWPGATVLCSGRCGGSR